MAIDLQTFAAGDTDYIAKLNADMAIIEAAVNALQNAQGSAGGAFSTGLFLDAVFQSTTSLIGVGSYKPTVAGTDLSIAPGSAYKATSQTVVTGIPTLIGFGGQPGGTYYIVPDVTGTPQRSTDSLDAAYSVEWSGTGFGAITRVAPALFTSPEEDAARKSTALNLNFDSLDLRLEMAESTAKAQAQVALDKATKALRRRVCLTMDAGETNISIGIKGLIQIDFTGNIVGWSLTASQSGDLTVEVSKKGSSAPPAVPSIPNPTSEKITASAPPAVAGAQTASGGLTEVASWTRAVAAWDVLQFNVTAVTGIKRATLVLWIQET